MSCSIWYNNNFISLSNESKLLFLYLYSGPPTEFYDGAFEIHEECIMIDLSLCKKVVKKCLDELMFNKLIDFSYETKWVFILYKEEKEEKENIRLLKKLSFEQFWKKYPRKVNKSKSFEIWKSKNIHLSIDEILYDLSKRIDWQTGNPFIPHPTTYLRGKRWQDEDKSIPVIKKEKKESILEAAMRLDREEREKISNEIE